MTLKKMERKAIEEEYKNDKVQITNTSLVPHGKFLRVGKNTNCMFYICHFEQGNEFVPKFLYNKIVEKYIKDNFKRKK